VGDQSALEREGADPEHALRPSLDIERLCREPRLGEERVQAVGEPGRRHYADPARRVELVAQVVAKGHEIDEVVGMQVADDHRSKPARIDPPRQPGEPALSKVQADALVTPGRRCVLDAMPGRSG
jgi:hypothetical protein